ncbi:unnamed protein product [Mytilus coruscus]|uniref:Uncharacterized protein n=1 Tax=Mytilus coruscus TaxID=42192 RepID=A0A6J8EZ78_MYTCO|nr:unnamed protein product [Mytilus coruscus]
MIEKLINFKSCVQALEVLAEEKEMLRKRNKILKIGDKHGWNTVNECLDSSLAGNKDDAAHLCSFIAIASRKRKSSKPYDRPSNKSTEGGNIFNTKNLLWDCFAFRLIISRSHFTKTITVLVQYWRATSILSVVCLDDGCGTADNSEICENMATLVKTDLEKSGSVVNNSKSTGHQFKLWND